METLCQRIFHASARSNGRRAIWKGVEDGRYMRRLSTTRVSRAAKPPRSSKSPPKKAQRKELEYRTPTRKPTPFSMPKPKTNPLRNRKIPFFFGGIALFFLSASGAYLYIAFTRPADHPIPSSPSEQPDVSARYNTIASSFDDEVDWNEYMMGITSLRKKLASLAYGDVLEVSIGTGRNLSYYDWNFKGHGGVGKVDNKGAIKKGKVRSFTAVDKSEEMLEIAHEKFSTMFPGILAVRWIIADAAEEGKIPGPPKNANETSGNLERKYDTVIQTMGLCSVGDPVGLLKNLGECVKEEDGRILLLEHGRGRWDWLNGFLDKTAEGHAKAFGCWWNRDLGAIVKDSGLEVIKVERPKWWHGGTTWWIELKKPKTGIKKVKDVKKDEPKEVTKETTATKKKGWW